MSKFKVGDRVVHLSNNTKYNGLTGTVISVNNNLYYKYHVGYDCERSKELFGCSEPFIDTENDDSIRLVTKLDKALS